MKKPNPSTVIVAVTSKLDKRVKLYATLAKLGYLHVLEAPKRLDGFVREAAQAQGVTFAPNAAARLIDAVGGDLSRLVLAIGQLGLYAGARPVTSDDVDELVADTRERSVFELTDAIGAGDRPRALAAVSNLCDQRESAVGVVVMLARHVRQMATVHVLKAANASRGEYPPKLGVPPFIVDKLVAQARNYSPAVLAAAVRELAVADRALKGDITLSTGEGDRFAGPQLKALGRELGERVILERVVDGIVTRASSNRPAMGR